MEKDSYTVVSFTVHVVLMDDYVKDGGLGRSGSSTMSLCALKTNVNKFAISSHTALKLRKQTLKSNLKITCVQLHSPPNKKVSASKVHEIQTAPGPPSLV